MKFAIHRTLVITLSVNIFSFLEASPRREGQGGAGIFAAPTIENPAYLGNLGDGFQELELLSPEISASRNLGNLATDAMNKSSIGTDEIINLIKKYQDVPFYVGLQSSETFTYAHTRIGLFQSLEANARVGTDPVLGGAEADVSLKVSTGPEISYGKSFDDWSVGARLKFMKVSLTQINLSTSELSTLDVNALKNLSQQNVTEGQVITLDPSVNYHYQSVSVGFMIPGLISTGKSVLKDIRSLNYALGYTETIENAFRIHGELYLTDLLNAYKNSFYQKIHLGLEGSYRGWVGFNLGLSEGYPTYGVFLNAKIINLELAYNTKELGVLPGENPSQRVHALAKIGWLL